MSLAIVALRPEPVRSLPFLRWGLLSALLLAEVMALTLRFDTGTLANETGLWAWLLGEAHHVPHLAIAMGTALLLFGWSRLRAELAGFADELDHTGSVWPLFVMHGLVFVAFTFVTGMLLEDGLQASQWRGLWAVAWLGLGLGSVAILGMIAVPARLWLRLLRRAALPLTAGVVVGLPAWGAGQLTDRLWTVLAGSTFWIVQQFLSLFGVAVVALPEEFIIGTEKFRVHIGPDCSGYEGMGLIWVFLGVYLWLFRRELRFPQALLLVPLGTAAIYLANAVRIAGLIAVGTWGSEEVAVGGFHSQAGWLAFNGVALGLIVLTRRLAFFTKREEADNAGFVNPAAPYLAPLLALVAAVMVTTALSTDGDLYYPLRVLAVAAVLLWFRRAYAVGSWDWSWSAVALGVAVFVMWLALEPLATATSGEGLPEGLTGKLLLGWLVFRVVGSVVTVPIAEELAFRGFLTRRLQGGAFQDVPLGRFTWLSFVVSSLIFGILHGRWLAGTLAGMVYAVALYRRGRLSDPIVAHAVTNGLIAVYVLSTGTWSLWA